MEEEFQFLLCQRCRKEAKNPKLLFCLHNLCTECLEESKPIGQCPICLISIRRVGGEALLDNMLFASLQEKLSTYQKITTNRDLACNRCKEGAEFWCNECNEFLCSRCHDAHQWYLKQKNHESQKLLDLKNNTAQGFLEEARKSCILFCSEPSHNNQVISHEIIATKESFVFTASIVVGAANLCVVLAPCLMGSTTGCPEPCACVDKYAQQFADCAYKDLQTVPAGLPSNVTTLSLSANKIAALPRGSFVEVTQVTSLWLAHNRIGAIEEGTLAILVQLKNLDVSHNQIVDFPWGDLRNLSALQLLKMNNNRMAHLPGQAFHTLRDLRSLRINSNRFADVAEGTFEPLTSLSHLQIYNNPFNCTCRLMWLKNWTENTLISIPERDSITCAAPEPWKGLPLAKIPYLHCTPPKVRLLQHPNLEHTPLYYGFALTLHCSAEGLPPPVVHWRVQASGQTLDIPGGEAGGNHLPPESSPGGAQERFRAFSNGTLLIPHLSKKEEGTYTCLATNEMGSNQTSVDVAVADSPKDTGGPLGGPKRQPGDRKPDGKASKNSVMKPDARAKGFPGRPTPRNHYAVAPTPRNSSGTEGAPFQPPRFEKKCGSSELSQYVSNHAFNQSADLKPHSFDLGVIALDVSERAAKVQITPFYTQPEMVHLQRLYLCKQGRQGHSLVQWSQIEEGVNSYWFQGLSPGTNYSVCMTYVGEECQVQVLFTTKKEVPSLIIIVVVSVFLLGLATIPLLGAACCHLLSKYQGKTYKLIMRTQNPDQMEKHMVADFDPRASYLESEKNFDPSEVEEGEVEEGGGEGEGEGRGTAQGGALERDEESIAASSIPESQSKTNPEEFEVGSEYSDRLPLGAEAVTISQEINGNYKSPPR
ncbi:LOW QUALITY PROTEIN: immunoglobulin superfamily containing leucine-rich repeat protein 2 [Varanus komodoensis]|uniref:LOW QUALITY PROTEIN: immunoglobulin superfamily containing leucine-rich repeat protein 2 n=1 Tax=Varanus komodoensis TaxID=61221 RepID=UPI001CF76BF6|nr:LOW QUALITY PROTEIN: immunoglobulin superfamily containing leucine-rich repeat protein 2 [Varanus komodoensis]